MEDEEVESDVVGIQAEESGVGSLIARLRSSVLSAFLICIHVCLRRHDEMEQIRHQFWLGATPAARVSLLQDATYDVVA